MSDLGSLVMHDVPLSLTLRVKRRQADMLVESKFDLHGNVIITVPFSQLTLYYRDCGLGHE